MLKRNQMHMMLFLGIVLSVTLNTSCICAQPESKTLPVFGKVNDFQLKDSNGAKFGLQQLKGKIWVIQFFYSRCTVICPITTKQMAELHHSYILNDDFELVSLTVDPKNDTWKSLAGFARTYKADTRKWHFLTGSQLIIRSLVVDSFKVSDDLSTVMHSARFALVDKLGRIRGYYDGTEEKDMQKLSQDVEAILKEK